MAEVCMLGIEIGGTKLQLGIGQGRGDLSALERLPVEPSLGSAGILAQIETAFSQLLETTNLKREKIRAAGVGFGGPVDSAQGRVQKSYQVPGWDNVALGAWVREHLGIPLVVVEN